MPATCRRLGGRERPLVIREEREGFEPSESCDSHDFQSCTFGHSVTSPEARAFYQIRRGLRPSVAGFRAICDRRGLNSCGEGGIRTPETFVYLISNQAPSATRTPLRRLVYLIRRSSVHGPTTRRTTVALRPIFRKHTSSAGAATSSAVARSTAQRREERAKFRRAFFGGDSRRDLHAVIEPGIGDQLK